MEKANTEEILALFEETEMTEFYYRAKEAKNEEEEKFFLALYTLKLQKRQQEVIQQDRFVM
ncbi:hypothetical protein OW156_07610 [Aerococcus sp. YH-aer221]|uniref:hypothetical protein n=1 Tax=Aerococcus kribbianus TaxID=2999064 RepID=UPI002286B01C|nr:hypothetical protein [Aerococcus sp. YH-aer221]MCZ0718131.1 hypothetical protein [Aerococcus sp. YH-aer221]